MAAWSADLTWRVVSLSLVLCSVPICSGSAVRSCATGASSGTPAGEPVAKVAPVPASDPVALAKPPLGSSIVE